MACAGLVGGTTEQIFLFYWPYLIVSMIWITFEISALHLSRATAILVVDWCQFGPSWIFGLKMELMAYASLIGGFTEQICLFPDITCYYKLYKMLQNCLHYTSSVPQPFLLTISANLALAGFLGRQWSLWPVPTWSEVKQSKAVFFLTLYDSINDMKHHQNCLHHTSALPQPSKL